MEGVLFMKRISLTVLSICLFVFSFFLPVSQVIANETHGNKVAVGKDGMVATARPLASEIGADVLKKVGTQWMLLLPFSTHLT